MDPDLPRQIYNITQKVREYGARIIQLHDLKSVSIENEDYMTAKKIKLEIEKIRSIVVAIDPFKLFATPSKSLGTAELKSMIEERSSTLS